MDNVEPFRAAILSIRANKLRSALTVLGIVIGVTAVIAVVSLIQGFKGIISGTMERFGTNTVNVQLLRWVHLPSGEWSLLKHKEMTTYDMRTLAMELPDVITGVTPVLDSYGPIKHKDRSFEARVSFTDETWLEHNKFDLSAGRNFVSADIRLNSKVAIIGKTLIEKLGIKGNPLGQLILFRGMDVEIIGVFGELGSNMLFDMNDLVLIPITTGMMVIPVSERGWLTIITRYKLGLDLEYVEDAIRNVMRQIRGLRPAEPDDFRIITMKREADEFDNIMAGITGVAGGMVGIALLVGGVGIMNIMLVSVTERTREIGVRKAVGAKRSHILVQFLIEATVLCLFGGALGILLGFISGTIASKILFNQVPGIPMSAFIIGFGVPALIGVFFGYYPAAKASKLDPIEALRHE
ncbi:MAG: ABC transporter permease [Holophagaceae bacterium]|nr:ABC transporter permease [Holophagaceae bacterium]